MTKTNEVFDISITIQEGMLSFPGDTIPEIERIKEIEKAGYNLSKMQVSVHVGTHADAPTHFVKGGKYIDEIKPERFMGETQVIEIKNENKITKAELKELEIKSDKLLFKTFNSEYLKEDSFNENFVYMTRQAAEYLVDLGVKLIGIDYLTIESLTSKDFAVHKLLLGNDVIILEAVNLIDIEPGLYNLLAFPLKLQNCEASPIRALLTR